MSKIDSSCFHLLRCQIRRLVSREVTDQLVFAFLLSRLDCCNSMLASGLPLAAHHRGSSSRPHRSCTTRLDRSFQFLNICQRRDHCNATALSLCVSMYHTRMHLSEIIGLRGRIHAATPTGDRPPVGCSIKHLAATNTCLIEQPTGDRSPVVYTRGESPRRSLRPVAATIAPYIRPVSLRFGVLHCYASV